MFDIAFAVIQLGHKFRIDIKTQNIEAGIRKRFRKRQANIAQANDGDDATR